MVSTEQQRLYVFAGSYAEANEKGVYVLEFDEATGALTETDHYIGLKNPTFLNVDAAKKMLYSISETVSEDGRKIGEAAAFTIDAAAGTIQLLNRQVTVDSTTCHIQRDADSRYLTVTSYHGGMVGLHRIEADGQIGEQLDVQQHEGSSADPDRQDRPHPHSSFYSPDGRFLLVQDLGIDRIVSYAVDTNQQKLIRASEVELQPGAGPRHLTFHPNGKWAFVINELDSTITSFAYDAENGGLTALETVSTLPADYDGDNGCAEITISQDGRFIYGSNRGHDSIVVYAVDEETGLLKLVQHVSVEGGHPRHFALTPNGQHLLAANRDTNNIAIFKVDQAEGTLQFTGASLTISKPVCVIPIYLTT